MSASSTAYLVIPLLVVAALLSDGPEARSAPAGRSSLALERDLASGVVLVAKRGRGGSRLHAPIAPSYIYYDYPYYYRRGFYPTHIRPGFIYFGTPYSNSIRSSAPRYGGRCSYWYRRCAREWSDHRSSRLRKAHRFGACTCP